MQDQQVLPTQEAAARNNADSKLGQHSIESSHSCKLALLLLLRVTVMNPSEAPLLIHSDLQLELPLQSVVVQNFLGRLKVNHQDTVGDNPLLGNIDCTTHSNLSTTAGHIIQRATTAIHSSNQINHKPTTDDPLDLRSQVCQVITLYYI